MNSPLFIHKIFNSKRLFNFLTLQECILNFSIMFEPSHLKSPIQNINNKKIIHKILQSFQQMKV